MRQERIQRYLLPGDIERDPGFREEIHRLSHIGLYVVGGAEIVVTSFTVLAHILLDPSPELLPYRLTLAGLLIALGCVTIGIARIRSLRPFARPAAMISGLVAACITTWILLEMTAYDPTADEFIPGNMTLIVLVAVVAIPLRPTDTLLFGFILESTYVFLAMAAQEFLNIGAGANELFVLFFFMLTCLATALTAVLYHQRRSAYEWHVHSMRTMENLRQAETRNLLAQNAASVGRLAAALSHELNSPVGALVSGVDTLLLLASRMAATPQEDQGRLVILQGDIRKSIRQSTDRLKEIVARMQRFTNLDKAEIQSANVNEILSDVAALVQPRYQDRPPAQLDLAPVPELVCRPQQLSAVFSNLIGNAFEASNGTGPVLISTRQNSNNVEVAIEDQGRGLAPDEVATIFEPGFTVKGGRVTSGNWSMFSSRQIVQEHGGDIRIESRKGSGTKIVVTLPVQDTPLT